MDVYYEVTPASFRCFRTDTLGRPLHLHKEFELIYVLDGRAIAHADRENCLIEAGDAFLVFPNQVHYYENNEKGDFVVVIFDPDCIAGLNEKIETGIPADNCYHSPDTLIADVILAMVETRSEDYLRTAVIGGINLILSRILPALTLKKRSQANSEAFYAIVNYCTLHYREDLQLDDLAEKLNLSKYYISHLINRSLNQNFNRFLNNLRVNAACNLLRETDKKISDIADASGFSTIRTFNRAFQDITGCSPADYRKRNTALMSRLRHSKCDPQKLSLF